MRPILSHDTAMKHPADDEDAPASSPRRPRRGLASRLCRRTTPTARAPGACALALAAVLPAQDSELGIYHPINDLTLTAGTASVVLNGSLMVNAPELQVVVNATPQNVPTGVQTEFSIRGGVTLEVAAGSKGTFSGTIPVGLVPLPPVQLGPTILVLPFAELSARISGEAEAGMRVSFVQEFVFGVNLAVGPGVSLTTTTPDLVSRFGQPDLTGSTAASLRAEVLAGMSFLVSWNGILLGGPIAGASFGVELTADPAEVPLWAVAGFAEPFVGWSAGGSYVATLRGLRFPIAKAAGQSVDANTRWSEALHVDGAEDMRAVLPTPNGLLAVARSAGDRPWIGELDPRGQLLAAVRGDAVPFASQRPVVALAADNDERIVIGHTAGEAGARIDRIDAAGNVTWTQTLAHSTAPLMSVADAVALPGGDFVVAGTATTIAPAGSVGWLARFAPDGTPRFAVEVQPGAGVTESAIASLARCANGDLVVAGFADFQESQGGNVALNLDNLWVARLDENGALAWAASAGTPAFERATCVTEAADGRLVVGTRIQDGGSIWAGLYTFEADGKLRGATAYHGDRAGIVTYDVVDVAATEGGVYVLGTRDPGGARDTFLAMMADDDTVLWWKTIGGAHEDDVLGLMPLADGLLAWGSTQSLDNLGSGTSRDAWIVRTDVDGMLHFGSGNDFDAHNDDVWWLRWSAVAAATTLTPAATSFSVARSVPPLTLSASTAQVTVLTDG